MFHPNKLHCYNLQNCLFRPFRSGFHLNFWKLESWRWSCLRISFSFKFSAIIEYDNTIFRLLSEYFGCQLSKTSNFDFKVCLITFPIMCESNLFNCWNLAAVISIYWILLLWLQIVYLCISNIDLQYLLLLILSLQNLQILLIFANQ